MNDAAFERLRARLHGVALRMLESPAEAAEMLEEARQRWTVAASEESEHADAWLLIHFTRLCLRRRERNLNDDRKGDSSLRGPLPSVVPATPEWMRERADDISVAYLTVLQGLPPEARTAFLLRVMFGVDYEEIALAIGKTEAECRALVQSAKARFRMGRPGYIPNQS